MAEVARIAGIPQQTLDGYLKGATPSADRAFALADALSVNLRWLITGEGPQTEAETATSDWLTLPRYDLATWAPDVTPAPVETMRIRRDWISRAVRASGRLWVTELLSDAMPDIGREGDLVLCEDVRPPLSDNHVYAFLLGGRPIVRRVQARPEGLLLKAADAGIDPIEVTGELVDQLVPIGRVLASITLQAV